jgi:hypothetical protein
MEIVHCSPCTLLPPREGPARGSPASFKVIEFFAAGNLPMEPIRLLEVELKFIESGLHSSINSHVRCKLTSSLPIENQTPE